MEGFKFHYSMFPDADFVTAWGSNAYRKAQPGTAQQPTTGEEAFLTSIGKSGAFTLEKVVNRYAGVRRLRDEK